MVNIFRVLNFVRKCDYFGIMGCTHSFPMKQIFFIIVNILCPGNIHMYLGFPGGVVVKNSPDKAGDTGDLGSTPGSGKSPGGGRGNPLQYSCLGNPLNRGTWWTTVHGVSKNWTLLKRLSFIEFDKAVIRVIRLTSFL